MPHITDEEEKDIITYLVKKIDPGWEITDYRISVPPDVVHWESPKKIIEIDIENGELKKSLTFNLKKILREVRNERYKNKFEGI